MDRHSSEPSHTDEEMGIGTDHDELKKAEFIDTSTPLVKPAK
jgi:hypothetical protein